MLHAPLRAALDRAGLAWEADVPLARRTTWRVGGPADALVTARTPDEVVTTLAIARAHGVPVVPLGAGSNVLVADAGVRGIVLVLTGDVADTADAGDVVVAGGGLKLTVLLARAAKAGWAGLEGVAGVPGTVGGAVRMNAGTSLGEIGDRVVQVEVATADGAAVLPAAALGFAYRTCRLPEGAVVTRAWLRVDGDAAASAERARTFLARRKATQPLDRPSCGSTFRNPPGDHAGRLIEAAGLKGARIGGAEVSDKHANFLLNRGDATAADLAALVALVQARVHAVHGVHLEPEVGFLGDWPASLALPEAS